MFWKKVKKEPAKEETKNSGQFKPKGEVSVTQAILMAWEKVPVIFSLHQICNSVRKDTGRWHLDTTISSAMRKLRRSGKINYRSESNKLSHYTKVF